MNTWNEEDRALLRQIATDVHGKVHPKTDGKRAFLKINDPLGTVTNIIGIITAIVGIIVNQNGG